jgi:hypothetical protein
MRRIGSWRIALPLGIAVAAVVTGTTVLAWATVGTRTTLLSNVGDMVRSDGEGDYVHDVECVASTRDTKKGATALRTASHTTCSDAYWQNGALALREVVLDFSLPVGASPSPCQLDDLNACGTNTIPDVRIHTANAFSAGALTGGTRVEIYVSFHPAENNTEFYIEYEQPLDVTGTATSRTITASPTAVAELYRVTQVRNKTVLTSVGRYFLPMQMVIGPN